MNSVSLHKDSEASSSLDDEMGYFIPRHASDVSQSHHDDNDDDDDGYDDLEQANPQFPDDGLDGTKSPTSNALLALAEEEDISVWLDHSPSDNIALKDKKEVDQTAIISSDSSDNSNGDGMEKILKVNTELTTMSPSKETESSKQLPESPRDDFLQSNDHPYRAVDTGASRKKFLICLVCWVISVILVIVIIVLSLRFRQDTKSNSGEESSLTTLKPTNAPSTSFPTFGTIAPTVYPTASPSGYATSETISPTKNILNSTMAETVDTIRTWIIEQNYSSPRFFEDADSPHSQAVKFMAEDDIVGIPNNQLSDSEKTYWLQRYVLTLLYYSLSGNKWMEKLNFVNHSLPTCSWYQTFSLPDDATASLGVLCPGKDEIVKEIRIARNGLMGSLPSELGLMTDLTTLSLEQNSIITGTIPNTLQKLTSLRSFLCLYCSLTGEIPNWIGTSWSELRVLGLTQNTIFGSIPSSMEKLTNLVVLGLDDNLLTGSLDALQSLPLLEQAYLENNYFVGNITDSFFNVSLGLKTLDASGNRLGGEVPIHLMSRLRVLDLHDNRLSVFQDAIPDDNSLALLALQKNPLLGTVPDTLQNLRALTHLDLSSTGLTGKIPELPDSTKLTYLFLANTNFDAGSIPKSYQKFTKMVDLSLKASSRTGQIPSWFDNLDELKLLDLHQNDLTGTIPPSLGNMTKLEFLLLNRNQLDGTIPSELVSASSLQIVFLDGNSLSGTMDPICNDAANLMASSADCGKTNSTEVICSCCNVCCVDTDKSCNSREYLSEYAPQWEDGYKRRFYDFENK